MYLGGRAEGDRYPVTDILMAGQYTGNSRFQSHSPPISPAEHTAIHWSSGVVHPSGLGMPAPLYGLLTTTRLCGCSLGAVCMDHPTNAILAIHAARDLRPWPAIGGGRCLSGRKTAATSP